MESQAIPPGRKRSVRAAWRNLNAASLSAAAAAGRNWGRRLGLGWADQGLVSSSHFLLAIVLVQLLRPADYGAFATAYAAFPFLAGMHTVTVAEPASVLGPAPHSDRRDAYFRATFRLDLSLSAVVAAKPLLVAAGLSAATSRRSADRPRAVDRDTADAVVAASPARLLRCRRGRPSGHRQCLQRRRRGRHGATDRPFRPGVSRRRLPGAGRSRCRLAPRRLPSRARAGR